MDEVQNANGNLFGRHTLLGVLLILIVGMIALGWVKMPGGSGPSSVTTVGISEPGSGAGIYNGLRAKSVPAVTELSRLERQPPGTQVLSFRENDIIQ